MRYDKSYQQIFAGPAQAKGGTPRPDGDGGGDGDPVPGDPGPGGKK